jgi:hypothetical protein
LRPVRLQRSVLECFPLRPSPFCERGCCHRGPPWTIVLASFLVVRLSAKCRPVPLAERSRAPLSSLTDAPMGPNQNIGSLSRSVFERPGCGREFADSFGLFARSPGARVRVGVRRFVRLVLPIPRGLLLLRRLLRPHLQGSGSSERLPLRPGRLPDVAQGWTRPCPGQGPTRCFFS